MKIKLKLKIPENKKNKCLLFDVSSLKDDEVRNTICSDNKKSL